MLERIWFSAVEATHDILSAEDVEHDRSRLVSDYLPVVDLPVAELGATVIAFTDGDGPAYPLLHLAAPVTA